MKHKPIDVQQLDKIFVGFLLAYQNPLAVDFVIFAALARVQHKQCRVDPLSHQNWIQQRLVRQ